MKNIKGYIKIARLDHWVKQMFILPGIVFALFMPGFVLGDIGKTLFSWDFFLTLLFGLLATCFIASANYVINEWLDREFDKFHPTKKNRPVVVGGLKGKIIYIEYAILTIVGLMFAFLANWFVFGAVAWLWFMGVIYNVKPIRSKEIVFVDVLSESINNMIRLLIGWFIVTTTVFPSLSILIGYWFGGAFLMATKRFAEYRMINNPEQAGLYRKSFKHYTEKSLMISAFLYALISVAFTTIFFLSYKAELLLSVPFLCMMFAYYFLLSFKEDSVAQKPEKLLKEKRLMLIVALFVVVFAICFFIDIPFISGFLDNFAI